MRTLWILLIALAVPNTAVAAAEFRLFVYPQSPTNTYQLPQYPKKGSTEPALSLCPKTKLEGLSFEPDGRTFHIDALPSGPAPRRRAANDSRQARRFGLLQGRPSHRGAFTR